MNTRDYGRNSAAFSHYTWRGGARIEIEKAADHFTVMPRNALQLERIRALPEVGRIVPLTQDVFGVEATPTDRDLGMRAVRSPEIDAIAHHAYLPAGSDGTILHITDRLAVAFRSGASANQIEGLLDKYALRVLRSYEDLPGTYVLQVTATSNENPVKIANRLASESIVEYAEPVMVNQFQPAFIPTDDLFARQWHLSAGDDVDVLEAAAINAPQAWDITRGNRSVVVAVIDDGFDLSHPDFSGPGKVVFPKDFVDGDSNPFPVAQNGDAHGTPCAGLAIAEINGHGVVGVAPGCAFMPIRFPFTQGDDQLKAAFDYAALHADVISLSWHTSPGFNSIPRLLKDTLDRIARTGGARGKGCVICVAAGNHDCPVNDPINAQGFVFRDPNTVTGLRTIHGRIFLGLPAHPSILAIAASTSLNRHSSYSNWGQEISVCAPSSNGHPLDPSIFVLGRYIWSTDNDMLGARFAPNSRYTDMFGGTSGATPLVAGVAALVISVNPNLTATEVRSIIESTADKILDTDPDIVLGVNRGMYDVNGHSEWFGFGKVNAFAAVAEAERRL